MHGWEGWLCLAWGLFVPGLGIALLIYINVKKRRK